MSRSAGTSPQVGREDTSCCNAIEVYEAFESGNKYFDTPSEESNPSCHMDLRLEQLLLESLTNIWIPPTSANQRQPRSSLVCLDAVVPPPAAHTPPPIVT